MRGAETDRKLYSEDLDSLTGIFFNYYFSPLLRTAYIKEPCFHPVPALGFTIADSHRHGTPVRNGMGRRDVERGFQLTSSPAALGHGAPRAKGRATCLPERLLPLVLSGL